MMPLQLFSNKTFTGANLLTFFLYAGLFSGIFISHLKYGSEYNVTVN